MTPAENLLAAARKAYPPPGYEWEIVNNWIVGRSYWGDPKDGRYWKTTFDINNARDQMALQIALEWEGWTFNAAKLTKDEYIFMASKPGHLLNEKTKPDLLLAIVREGV